MSRKRWLQDMEQDIGRIGYEVGNRRYRKEMNGEKLWRMPRLTKSCRTDKGEEEGECIIKITNIGILFYHISTCISI